MVTHPDGEGGPLWSHAPRPKLLIFGWMIDANGLVLKHWFHKIDKKMRRRRLEYLISGYLDIEGLPVEHSGISRALHDPPLRYRDRSQDSAAHHYDTTSVATGNVLPGKATHGMRDERTFSSYNAQAPKQPQPTNRAGEYGSVCVAACALAGAGPGGVAEGDVAHGGGLRPLQRSRSRSRSRIDTALRTSSISSSRSRGSGTRSSSRSCHMLPTMLSRLTTPAAIASALLLLLLAICYYPKDSTTASTTITTSTPVLESGLGTSSRAGVAGVAGVRGVRIHQQQLQQLQQLKLNLNQHRRRGGAHTNTRKHRSTNIIPNTHLHGLSSSSSSSSSSSRTRHSRTCFVNLGPDAYTTNLE